MADHGRPIVLPPRAVLESGLPKMTEYLVVGGGIVGCAVAYFLARAGREVLLLEQGELNREASGTNAGSFHFQIALHQLSGAGLAADRPRLVNDLRLHAAAADLWNELEREIDADLGVHVTGGLMLAETPEEVAFLREKQAIEYQAGLTTEFLEGTALSEFAPYLGTSVRAATYCPKEGHANPLLAAPQFAARAIDLGAEIRTHVGVHDMKPAIDDGSAGRGYLVLTSQGSVQARHVVNAAGAWAGDLARLQGVRLGMWREGLHVNVTEPRAPLLGPMLQHIGRRLTLKQATNGTFIIGGGWPARPEEAPLRYSVRWGSAAGNLAIAVDMVPALAEVRLLHTWTGVMAFTNDLLPILGELPGLPGCHVCVAATGFTLGPYLARMLVENLIGERSEVPSAYSPNRFATRREISQTAANPYVEARVSSVDTEENRG